MNERLMKQMRRGHEKQAGSIRKLSCYAEIERGFEVEYQVALELSKARKRAHMTQRDVAEAMHTTQSVISRIERGANVSIETLERDVSACGCHLQVRVV